jgi:hypothetical protein
VIETQHKIFNWRISLEPDKMEELKNKMYQHGYVIFAAWCRRRNSPREIPTLFVFSSTIKITRKPTSNRQELETGDKCNLSSLEMCSIQGFTESHKYIQRRLVEQRSEIHSMQVITDLQKCAECNARDYSRQDMGALPVVRNSQWS